MKDVKRYLDIMKKYDKRKIFLLLFLFTELFILCKFLEIFFIPIILFNVSVLGICAFALKTDVSELHKHVPKDIKVFNFINLIFEMDIVLMMMAFNGIFLIPFYGYYWYKFYPRRQGEDHEKFTKRTQKERRAKALDILGIDK